MTAITPRGGDHMERLERIWRERPGVLGWLTTTDHKRIGIMYFFTALAFFGAGGVEAMLIRTQLIGPNGHVLSPAAYDEVFTMHGITMIFLFVIPMTTGAFGNYLVPLMIGARDMAFPRLNALSYWIFLGSGIFMYVSLLQGHAPNSGWFDYVPLASKQFDPGNNIDFYGYGLIFNGISSTIASINFIVTIFKLRAPGMSINRMPLFCFAFLAVAFALLFALPSLSVATLFLELDRQLGFHLYDSAHGGDPLLWQNLFWIFGHPEVYIIILPAFGIATSIIPAFTHRRMVFFPLVALSEILVAFLGFGVWVHHMFTVGYATVTTVYFAAASLIITIPSAIQIFAWIATILTGTPQFKTPMLFIIGFIVYFIIGGLSGITVAAIPFDQQVHDSYYIVAHFHFVIFGAAVYPILGGMYFWFPKVTGRMYHEGVGKVSFWLTFIGTFVTFFPMHIVGILGMPRRNYTYPPGLGWTLLNFIESIGAYLMAAGLLLIVGNLAVSLLRGPKADENPFEGDTLEWSTTSPPPSYNYPVIPTVTSPYPMWDKEDRDLDRERLAQGVDLLERGHETPATTAEDAAPDEILDMPSNSLWPPVCALTLTGVFAMLLMGHYWIAAGFGALGGLTLIGWHLKEAGVARVRRAMPNGMWGMALFLCSEVTIFGTMIGSYFYLGFESHHWPPRGIAAPSVALPLIATAGLLTTSLPMWLASRAARLGERRRVIGLISLALLVQLGYLAAQVLLFRHDIRDFSPGGSAYGSIYFTLLATHHAHVLLGILLGLAVLGFVTLRGLSNYFVVGVRGLAVYWHVVNVVAIFVVLTQLSPSL